MPLGRRRLVLCRFSLLSTLTPWARVASPGSVNRKEQFNLQTEVLSPLPKSFHNALADPHWRQAMSEEFHALQVNDTSSLVPRPLGVNIVIGKWVFRHKLRSDGSLERYKAWMLHGFTQHPRTNFDKTFSPVVKPDTVHTVLTLALSRNWPIHKLDVKNVFLRDTLTETVYCTQPSEFVDPSCPDHVCRLNKSLYGLKQAPRVWYNRFASYLIFVGFTESKADTSLFIYHHGADTCFFSAIALPCHSSPAAGIFYDGYGSAAPFFRSFCHSHDGGLLLSQGQYTLDILERASMRECKPCNTPVGVGSKLSAAGDPVPDPTHYRSIAGAL